MSKKQNISRRHFLQTSGALALSAGLLGRNFAAPAFARERNPNGKLNIVTVGTAGMQGAFHFGGIVGENVFAICDVDENMLNAAGERFPEAKRFVDFRQMFAELGDKIDAALVTTPDHTHAVASIAAMKLGIPCYCEKPLAHTVEEVRRMTDLAKEKKLITQMGTQVHAGENYRRVVELIQAGAIGPVEEVHVWCGARWGGLTMPTEFPEVPKNLHWDLWLGPVPHRPYYPCYFGGRWRAYWAFGNGSLGDMGCHHIDLPFWALKLKYPNSIESTAPTPVDPECTPNDMIAKYEFPARDNLPPVRLTWYDGEARPPLLAEKGLPAWGAGTLFVGKEGLLLADYGNHLLYPEEKFKDYKRPEKTIPDSPGHHAEWIAAIKSGKGPTSCDFGYSGPVAETVLLGTLAYRLGKKLDWDAANLKVRNAPEADALLKKKYPEGWTIN